MKKKSQFRSRRGAKRFGRQPQKPLQNVLPTRSPTLGSTFSQTLALHQAGRLAEAEQNYLQILKAQPNQFDCLHLLGVIFYQRGNHAEAVRQIDIALKINPKVASAHNNRGNALKELKRFDEALASYDKALALKPDYAHAFYNRGNALQELKRLDEALASYDKALALKPDYANAFYNRGSALRELRRFDEALASYDRALAARPDQEDHARGVRRLDATVACSRRQRVVAAARQCDGRAELEERGGGARCRSRASGICATHEARRSSGAA